MVIVRSTSNSPLKELHLSKFNLIRHDFDTMNVNKTLMDIAPTYKIDDFNIKYH